MPQDWTSLFAQNMVGYEGYNIGKLFKHLSNPDIISLAAGLPSPDTFPTGQMQSVTNRLLQEDVDSIMQYVLIGGEPGLRQAVIELLRTEDIDIGEENLLITTSAQQGLDVVSRMLCNSGEVIILERPTFAGAICAFEMQKPIYAGAPMQEDGADIGRMRDILESYAKINVKPKFIYVVPDFQNPSGITMSLEKRQALLDLSYEYGVLIVEDSPYRWLRFSGQNIPSIYSLDQERGGNHVVGIYTFSKFFCPGMRVGFNIGPAPLIEMMTNIKEGSTLCTPKYNQDMCTAFLTEMGWQEHLDRARVYYREKADIFLKAMERHFPPQTGVSWTKPEGGMFAWAMAPKEIDTMELFHKAIERGVAFVPGEAFYAENPERNTMRISFSFPPKNQLDEAVGRLADCLKEMLD
jgi:2-aminoadipate transaminase